MGVKLSAVSVRTHFRSRKHSYIQLSYKAYADGLYTIPLERQASHWYPNNYLINGSLSKIGYSPDISHVFFNFWTHSGFVRAMDHNNVE